MKLPGFFRSLGAARPSGHPAARDPSLQERLRGREVSISTPDPNTIRLGNVPPNASYFNKSRTNILIKKSPFTLCVDSDLEYLGDSPSLRRAFDAAISHRGWRVLFLGNRSLDESADIRRALAVVGFDGTTPTLVPASSIPPQDGRRTPLAEFGKNLSREAERAGHAACMGRGDAIEAVLTSVLQREPRLVLVTGPTGVGKTNLLHAVARQLANLRFPFQVVSVDLGSMMAGTLFDGDRERLLASILGEASASAAGVILALEHFEQAVFGVPRGPLLLTQALDSGLKVIGTNADRGIFRFLVPPLVGRTSTVELKELSLEETLEVVTAQRTILSNHHRTEIESSLLPAVVERARSLKGLFPSKALALLDAAAAHARLSGAARVRLEDVYLAATRFDEETE